MSIFENVDGNGNFGPQQVIGSNRGSLNGGHAADIDRDGDLDILAANYTASRIDWYRNDLPLKVVGDTNGDEQLSAADIDRFHAAVRGKNTDPKFDLTGDQTIDHRDVDRFVQGLLSTTYGDANLDRRFDSSDIVQVFQAGKYENALSGYAGWWDGDWNGDGRFDTADLVLAFEKGRYSA